MGLSLSYASTKDMVDRIGGESLEELENWKAAFVVSFQMPLQHTVDRGGPKNSELDFPLLDHLDIPTRE